MKAAFSHSRAPRSKESCHFRKFSPTASVTTLATKPLLQKSEKRESLASAKSATLNRLNNANATKPEVPRAGVALAVGIQFSEALLDWQDTAKQYQAV